MPKNNFTYDVTHKKSATPNQKFFFQVQKSRLAKSFERLNSTLAQSAEELGNRKLLVLGRFPGTMYS